MSKDMSKEGKTGSDCDFDALVAELDRRFHKAGFGSKKAILKQLKLSEHYLKMAYRRRSLKVKTLLDLAETVGTSLPELVSAVQRNQPDWRREPPLGQVPPVVERVLLEELRRLESEDETSPEPEGTAHGQRFEQLRCLRLEDPRGCLEELMGYPTADLSRPHRIEYLTLLGATFRRLVRLREANHALHAALDLCQPEGSLSTQADILLKLAHLEYEHGHSHRALWLTEQAICHYELAENLHGLGAALLDYAMWLHSEGHLERAWAALQSAEPKIDPANIDLRFMHCLGMATLLECRGELEEALRYQEQGLGLAEQVGKTQRPPVFVTGARLKARLGDREGAVEDFLAARNAYEAIDHPVRAAIAAIDALQQMVQSGEKQRGTKIALGMVRLVFPLADVSPMAEAAVAELVEHAKKGRHLEARRLESLKERLEEAEAELSARRRKGRRQPYRPPADRA